MQNQDDQQQQAAPSAAPARERFSKKLTQFEVEKRLILFPLTAVAVILNVKDDHLFFVDVVDCLGQAWTFLGSVKSNYEDLGTVVSITWPQFMTEKGLKANDEVIFTGQSPDETPFKKFKVELKRKIRLFGQDMWGDLKV